MACTWYSYAFSTACCAERTRLYVQYLVSGNTCQVKWQRSRSTKFPERRYSFSVCTNVVGSSCHGFILFADSVYAACQWHAPYLSRFPLPLGKYVCMVLRTLHVRSRSPFLFSMNYHMQVRECTGSGTAFTPPRAKIKGEREFRSASTKQDAGTY